MEKFQFLTDKELLDVAFAKSKTYAHWAIEELKMRACLNQIDVELIVFTLSQFQDNDLVTTVLKDISAFLPVRQKRPPVVLSCLKEHLNDKKTITLITLIHMLGKSKAEIGRLLQMLYAEYYNLEVRAEAGMALNMRNIKSVLVAAGLNTMIESCLDTPSQIAGIASTKLLLAQLSAINDKEAMDYMIMLNYEENMPSAAICESAMKYREKKMMS